MTNEQKEKVSNIIKQINDIYQKDNGSQYIWIPAKVYCLLFGNHEKYKNFSTVRMSIKDICQLCKNYLELIGCYEKDFIAELCDRRHKKNMSDGDLDDENERLEDAKIMNEMLE